MKRAPATVTRVQILSALADYCPSGTASRAEIQKIADELGTPYPHWIEKDARRHAGRGRFIISLSPETVPALDAAMSIGVGEAPEEPVNDTPEQSAPSAPATTLVAHNALATENLIPKRSRNYVPFGNYTDVKQIAAAGIFYPTFITGLSGNGKTQMVEQVCAELGREYVRVNITAETDEDDLIGGFRLVNGNTVFEMGPIPVAMERGAVLLLDEIDLATNKIMCLQAVLEGKPILIKKIGKVVRPAPGFQVFATANTKGKGSDDGRFIGTNVLNEAFLERFPVTMEQEYPEPAVERKIIVRELELLGVVRETAVDIGKRWVDFAANVRRVYLEGGVSELISTRRLVHMSRAYAIFGNEEKALQLCINRFDNETKSSFLEYWKACQPTDADGNTATSTGDSNVANADNTF